MYQFIETFPGESDFELFEQIPRIVYPYYKRQHHQKNQINMDFLKSCIILLQDEKPIGRAALYVNPYLKKNGLWYGGIGNYECIDDPAASQHLLAHASQRLSSFGVNVVLGPFNGSTWDNYRFNLPSDHPNFFLETFNPFYYNEQFTTFGFKPLAHYVSALDHELDAVKPKVNKKEKEFREKGVVFRNIDLDNYEEELKRIYEFCMRAFSHNLFFTPISWESFKDKYLPVKRFIDPKLVILAESANNELIGMVFSIQDFLNLDEKSLVVKTLARSREKQWSGMGLVLSSLVYRKARKLSFDSVIHAYMVENSFTGNLSKEYTGEPYKRYALYGLKLSEILDIKSRNTTKKTA